VCMVALADDLARPLVPEMSLSAGSITGIAGAGVVI
jgi:hypothetical protein